jgi:hypothetical protein
MWVALAACGDDGARHIVDGQGSGSGSAGPSGGVVFYVYPGSADVYAYAYFTTMIDVSLPSDCVQTVQGGCQLTTCATPYAGATGTYLPAGTITVVGGVPATTYTLTQSAMNTYTYGPLDNDAIFNDGDTITVAGTGAGTGGAMVPAFSQPLTIPTLPQITAPLTTVTAPRTSDFPISWTGGAHLDTSMFELYQMTPYEVLACSVTGTANSGTTTLPSTLLEKMTPGTLTLIGVSTAVTTAKVGDFPTTFAVGGELGNSDGDVYVGKVTLQ